MNTHIREKLQAPEFGSQLLNNLDKHFGVNTTQFNDLIGYAGGAVASMVFNLLDLDIDQSYKDLDVWVTGSGRKIRSSHFTDIEAWQNGSGWCSISYSKYGYYIYDTTTQDRINTITVCPIEQHQPLTIQTVVDGFDLNSVQCGVSKEGHFYFTEAFLAFLSNPELRISNYSTPTSSFIRLVHKAKSSGLAIANGEIEKFLTCLSIEHESNIGNSARVHAGALFGNRKKTMLLNALSKKELFQLGIKVESIALSKTYYVAPWHFKILNNSGHYTKKVNSNFCWYRLVPVKHQHLLDYIPADVHGQSKLYRITKHQLILINANHPENLITAIRLLELHSFRNEVGMLMNKADFTEATIENWTKLVKYAEQDGLDESVVTDGGHLNRLVENYEWMAKHAQNQLSTMRWSDFDAFEHIKKVWHTLPLNELKPLSYKAAKLYEEFSRQKSFESLTAQIELPTFPEATVTELTTLYDIDQYTADLADQNPDYLCFAIIAHRPIILFQIKTTNETSYVTLEPQYSHFIDYLDHQEVMAVQNTRHIRQQGMIDHFVCRTHYSTHKTEVSTVHKHIADTIIKAINQYLANDSNTQLGQHLKLQSTLHSKRKDSWFDTDIAF